MLLERYGPEAYAAPLLPTPPAKARQDAWAANSERQPRWTASSLEAWLNPFSLQQPFRANFCCLAESVALELSSCGLRVWERDPRQPISQKVRHLLNSGARSFPRWWASVCSCQRQAFLPHAVHENSGRRAAPWSKLCGNQRARKTKTLCRLQETSSPAVASPTPPARPAEPLRSDTMRSVDVATIGKSVIVKGELSGSEDLYVDGQVEGSIALRGQSLTIGPNGRVRANIEARNVILHGRVDGNVTASERVELRKSASLTGDITTVRIAIDDGAYFKGTIDIQKPEPARVEAKPQATASFPLP